MRTAASPEAAAFLAQLDPDAETAWQDRGLCAQADPDAWFPDKGESARPAKAVCRGCPVRTECLTYALEHGERHGIWGGLTERQRRRLKPAAQSAAQIRDVPRSCSCEQAYSGGRKAYVRVEADAGCPWHTTAVAS